MVTKSLWARKTEAESELLRCTMGRKGHTDELTPPPEMLIGLVLEKTPEPNATGMLSGMGPDVVLKSPSLQLAWPSGRAEKLTVFFFNDTATTEVYALSLHDALPISDGVSE